MTLADMGRTDSVSLWALQQTLEMGAGRIC